MGLVLHRSSCWVLLGLCKEGKGFGRMLAALQCVAFVVCNYFYKINNKEKNQEEYSVLLVLRSLS